MADGTTSPAFVIEQGIPIPTRAGGTGVTAAIRALAESPVGSSVMVPKKPARLGPFFRPFGHGWYATRAVEGGARVWKIREPKAAAQ